MKIIKNTLNKHQSNTKKNIKNGSLNMIDYTDWQIKKQSKKPNEYEWFVNVDAIY